MDEATVRRVSVVVPTYREVENIPLLIERLAAVRESTGLVLDVLFMDDNSQDGSAELVAGLAIPWVKLVTRTAERGLSAAVLDGLKQATGEVLVVMDADLSHPPETIPLMLAELEAGADFVLGSRFVAGGTTDDEWGIFRWLNSKIATLLALPLAPVRDPMSGFFMLLRSTFEAGRDYQPIGYKIGLELLVKCNCRRPVEVPIHFQDRQFGDNKLSLREQLRYLQHIRRLYIYRFSLVSQLIQFAIVGALGVLVNLLVLTVALELSVPRELAVLLAIVVSMVSNFFLNRNFSFSYARTGSAWRQFTNFVTACSFGAVVNYVVTLVSMQWIQVPQVAAIVGVVAGMGFNFLASRYWVFRIRHVAKKKKNAALRGPTAGSQREDHESD